MAGIFTRFTLRSLAQNRVRTAVTVVGIALSTALLAAVLTSVASVQQGLLERTMVTEGSSPFLQGWITSFRRAASRCSSGHNRRSACLT